MTKTDRIRAEATGRRAEYIAAVWLRIKGYAIAARNFRCHSGEIDVIAVKGDVLAFIEVKYRRDLATAQAAVSDANWARISQAAGHWIGAHAGANNLNWRYDLIAICPWRRPHHCIDFWRPHY